MPPKQKENRAVMFLCTKNNPDTTMLESYLEKWHKEAGAVFVTGQLEKGKEGTPHLQFFLHFAKEDKKSIAGLSKYDNKVHYEIVK